MVLLIDTGRHLKDDFVKNLEHHEVSFLCLLGRNLVTRSLLVNQFNHLLHQLACGSKEGGAEDLLLRQEHLVVIVHLLVVLVGHKLPNVVVRDLYVVLFALLIIQDTVLSTVDLGDQVPIQEVGVG